MEANDQTARAMENHDGVSFDEWIQLVGNRFVPLTVSTIDPDGFSGSLRTRVVDGTCVTDIAASSHSVHRLPEAISDDDPHHLKLSMQLEGTGLVMQDGRSAHLTAGDVAIYDTARPYTLEYDGPMRSLVMIFPHSMLGLSANLVHTVTAVRLRGDTGIGRVICPFMQHMAEEMHLLDGVSGARIMRSAFDLITALLSAELHDSATREPWRVTLDAVAHYIDAHLEDAALNTDSLARAHFISSRQLQYLFQEEGLTVSGYIRQRRLERCRLDLEDPALASRSIVQIGQSWGFVDPSHFSKLFKATYGRSPRDHRLAFVDADVLPA
ncbi:helix-turn-helix domain-containing protein [Microbacterium sp. RD1]|uniref:AraC-like ligand-binding domain-containing protein n=1 Tax=Microbacterium sp. RD1 TaxID=3457313 RepID=UPI003FA52775